jgi:class 3 adenylate cyclase
VPRYQAYLLSTAATGVAFAGRFVLDPLLLDNAPFIFFLPAVLAAHHFFGSGPAWLATGLGLALGDVFFQAPRGGLSVSYDAIAEGVAYLVVAFLILWFWPVGQEWKALLERHVLDAGRQGVHRSSGSEHGVARGLERPPRRLAAILAADVVGYSRLMGVDEEGTLAALKALRRQLHDRKIAEHRGRIVKTTGDGLLVEFASVVDAVRCAVEVQQEMAGYNGDVPAERRIEFRIGINLGDIIIDDGDIYGDGVNIAARLEALAEPGGICVSRNVRDQVRDKLDLAFEDLGEQQVKNIARAVRVYRACASGAVEES